MARSERSRNGIGRQCSQPTPRTRSKEENTSTWPPRKTWADRNTIWIKYLAQISRRVSQCQLMVQGRWSHSWALFHWTIIRWTRRMHWSRHRMPIYGNQVQRLGLGIPLLRGFLRPKWNKKEGCSTNQRVKFLKKIKRVW